MYIIRQGIGRLDCSTDTKLEMQWLVSAGSLLASGIKAL
jgi:hypothetical protein